MSTEQLNKIIKNVNSWNDRLEWNDYFMSIAFLTSSRSPCSRLHVGCVIAKDKRIISTGYNGFLPGADHTSYVIDGHEQATIHSEQNCISDCAKRGVSIANATAYITHFPCINCFKVLAASGITEIKYAYDYNNDDLVYVLADKININIIKYSGEYYK